MDVYKSFPPRKVYLIMRVVTNQPHVKRNQQIAQYLFFISLAILFGGLLFTNTLARENDLLLLVPCLAMPLGLITTMISVRLTNQYVRPPHPEDAIREGLKGINRRSVLYNYVLPTRHVLLAPQGVYTFTTRFQESRFKIEGDKWFSWKARGPLAPLFLFLKQESLGDPFGQAEKEAQTVQTIVDEALPKSGIKVQPVVVFTGQKAILEVDNPTIPVVYADPKKKPSLKGLLRDEQRSKQDKVLKDKEAKKAKRKDRPKASEEVAVIDEDKPAVLTPDQIETIDEAILSTLNDRQRERQLVEEI